MKKLLILLSILVFTSLTFAQVTPFDMIAQDGSTGADYTYDVWVDDAGNKYITGKYKTEIDFGGGVVITPINNYDVFVAKYDKDNNIQWANSFGGYSADEGRAVAVDSDGSVVVAASFFSTVSFGTDTLFSHGNFDLVLVKYDASGNYLWAKHAHSDNQDKPGDMKIDSQGNYILTGYYGDDAVDTLKYEGYEIISEAGEREVFVLKTDSNGNPIWGATCGGADNDYSTGLVLDADDNIYIDGYYDNVPATFGNIILPNDDQGYEIFVAKLNSSGTFQWASSANGSGDDKAYAIEYVFTGDSTPGVVLLTGYFEDSLYVGADNELFESAGDDDLFVLAFTSDVGAYNGGLRFGGEEDEQGKAIVSIKGDGGGYFVGGTIESSLSVPNDSLENYGKRDMLVMRLDEDSIVWAKNFGGSDDDYINAGYIDDAGLVYFAGNFKSPSAEFDPYLLSTAGSYDLWLGQMYYVTPPSAPIILAVEDIPNDQGGKVRIQFTGSELTKTFSIWRQIDGTTDWDAVGSFNGISNSMYSYVAQTLGDSTDQGIVWSTFKISSHADASLDFFMSDPVSGYSIDNLAPAVPAGIIAVGHEDRVEIAWDDSEDKDFQFYAIYRSTDSEFNPDTMNTATYTTIESSFDDASVELGKTYYYRIVAVDFSGNQSEYSENIFALVTDVASDMEIPTVYELGQNYPNPFNPSTVIKFSLPESGLVTLKVFNLLGQEVMTLVNEVRAIGNYEVSFNASNLTTGMYVYRIESGEFTATKKMMLVK